ncbi:MAG TPA: putative peptidoglycan glycosyltransferase FtsW, partial [Candidatus Binataceae bacterium]|nr:putative peptidoglycan glycosyltransferase FtsW [Candidatus Binataceae bacterium]
MQNVGEYFRNWFGRSDAIRYRRPDPWLLVPASALLALGLLMVLNTTYFLGQERNGEPFHLFKLQLEHIAAGAVALMLLSQFSVAGLRRLTLPLMVLATGLLIAIWIPGLGVTRSGARRWVRIGPMLAEPSELVKFAIVFFLADFIARRQDVLDQFKRGPLPAMIVTGIVALLVLMQPDFGTTVIIALILFAMLFAGGVRAQHLAGTGAAALVILMLQAVAKPYRLRRLETFINPWRTARGAGFQLIQSFIALGEGGKWGTGLGAGRQKMFYLPAAHTDFVFAVVTEEFGMVGAAVVLALFGIILVRGLRIAHEEQDSFASMLAVGLTAMIAMQA